MDRYNFKIGTYFRHEDGSIIKLVRYCSLDKRDAYFQVINDLENYWKKKCVINEKEEILLRFAPIFLDVFTVIPGYNSPLYKALNNTTGRG